MWVCCCCSWSYFVSFPASFPPLVLNIVLCLFPSIWAHKQVSLSLFLGVVERCCCERRRCIRLAHCVNPPDGTVCLEGAPRSKNHPGTNNKKRKERWPLPPPPSTLLPRINPTVSSPLPSPPCLCVHLSFSFSFSLLHHPNHICWYTRTHNVTEGQRAREEEDEEEKKEKKEKNYSTTRRAFSSFVCCRCVTAPDPTRR